MKKKQTAKSPSPGAEFFAAVAMLEKEEGIPRNYLFDRIKTALLTAYKKENNGVDDNVFVELDEDRKEIRMVLQKYVVETVENPQFELSAEEARLLKPGACVGDRIETTIPTQNFGRIAAQNAKQVIVQGLREAKRGMIYQSYQSHEQDVVSARVIRPDQRYGGHTCEITWGGNIAEAHLPQTEQMRDEVLNDDDLIKAFVLDIRQNQRGVLITLSRTHPTLLKKLFEVEVPEIGDGLVTIQSIAREAGQRSKIAVDAAEPDVDPVGACIGIEHARISAISNQLGGEKIDIVRYDADPVAFVANALAPADVLSVTLVEEKSCRVVVPDDQLSLAIGKEGQNARLAAKLTGLKIDIKPESREEDNG